MSPHSDRRQIPPSPGSIGSPAKITRPVPTGCLLRTRLFRELDRARKRPLIWIAGPPGSGKTTLVSSYVGERRLPALWYQVDEGDADLASFFYYLGLAGKKAAPRRRSALPLLTPEYLPGLSVFVRRFFESLYGRLKIPSVLVFDNCQSVTDDALLHSAFLEAASLLPKGLNLILVSREIPPPGYARLRANEGMAVLGWGELRLTPEEAAGIARLRARGRKPGMSVKELHARADGWAAGIVLYAEAARLGGTAVLEMPHRPPDEIVDYFGSEVLRSLDPGVQEFLLRSAFLPQMTAKAAATVTGIQDAGRILAQLHRRNYFTQRHPGEEPVYEYHALFRDFLLTRAAEAFSAEEAGQLRRAAARQLEAGGRFEDAVTLYREAGDLEGLARVIATQAPQLLAQGRNRMLLEWLGHLPQEAIEATPWLQCWRGFALLPEDPGAGGGALEEAFRAFRSSGDAAGAFLSWSGVVESFSYDMLGSFGRFDPWIAEMDFLLQQHGEFPSLEIETRVISAMIKGLFLRGSGAVDGEKWARRALTVSRSAAAPHLKMEALFSLALFWLTRGDLAEFEGVLGALRPFLRSPEVPALPRLTAMWMETAQCLITARFERCLDLVAEGLALAAASGVRLLDGMLLGSGALAHVHQGELRAAVELLRQMKSVVANKGPWEAGFYHLVSAAEALNRGDLTAALRHYELESCGRNMVGDDSSFVIRFLLSSMLAEGLGEKEKMRAQLTRAWEYAKRSGNRSMHAQCALATVYVALGDGDPAGSGREFGSHLKFARESGVKNFYFRKPGLLERIAAAALETGVEVDYARELIKLNRLKPGDGFADLEAWPWPVKIYTLGRFELLREDRPVEFGRKVQQKPLLLLKTLIAMGGHGVSEGRLTDALWPEADGDLGHQSFSAALHRLRQILGTEEALLLKEGKLSLSADVCWVDSWAFARLVAQAEKIRTDGKGTGRRQRLLGKALALYQGPFLAGEGSGAPLSSARDRLRDTLLGAAEALGRHHEAAGRWEEALPCYRQAVEADGLAEPFVRRLVACCVKAGREAEAVAVRRAYESALAASRRA